jgi:hypothetical protein
MECAFCQQPAERACTRCGRFFCPTHGGERRVLPGPNEPGIEPVSRVVCDGCTPDAAALASADRDVRWLPVFLIGFAALLAIGVPVLYHLLGFEILVPLALAIWVVVVLVMRAGAKPSDGEGAGRGPPGA